MRNIYIGIDGGGTKTKAIVTDDNFRTIGTGLGGASNIRLSVTESWKSIYSAVNEALKNSGITLEDKKCCFHAGMGLAGVSILKAKKEFLETPHPFANLFLESDAHIGCLGAHDGKDGAIISVGTGVIGYLIKDKSSYRVGGWGFPHADLGGGAWIGLEASRLTFKAIDGAIKASGMTEAIFSRFSNDLPQFVTWACAAKSSDFASLAPTVLKHLKREDIYAKEIIRSAALEIDALYKALNLKSGTPGGKTRCALLGGLAKILYAGIEEKQHIFLPDDSKTPELGAIYMIQQKLSLSFHKIEK